MSPAQQAAADDLVLNGQIRSFECEDNCYLTLEIEDNVEVTALCTAPQCEPWNEQVAIPGSLIGAKVTVHASAGFQFDGRGSIMGLFPAFTHIELE